MRRTFSNDTEEMRRFWNVMEVFGMPNKRSIPNRRYWNKKEVKKNDLFVVSKLHSNLPKTSFSPY